MSLIIDERVAGGRPTRPAKVTVTRTTALAKLTSGLTAFLLR